MPSRTLATDTLAVAVATAPAVGTVETWTVTNTPSDTAGASGTGLGATPPYDIIVGIPGGTTPTGAEICHVTAVNVAGKTITLTRGYAGSTPVTHLINSILTHIITGEYLNAADVRLNAPLAHAASHAAGGTDATTLTEAQITGLTTDLAAKAPLASPTFTGVPAAPTAAPGTNTTQLATTAFVTTASATPALHAATHAAGGTDPVTLAESQITNLTTDLAAKAPLASPALTGTPTAPTAAPGTNTTQLATTAFVAANGTVAGIYNVKNYGAKGDLRQVSDASITSGSPIVTSATAAFTQADVGKTIRVTDAPSSTVRLNSTILSVQSATQATANANAAATLATRYMEIATDDTVAIQAAIDAPGGVGAICLLPPGAYKITATLNLRSCTKLVGSGSGYVGTVPSDAVTVIYATSLTTSTALLGPANSRHCEVRDLKLVCPGPNTATSTSVGVNLGASAFNGRIDNCIIGGGYKGIVCSADQNTVISNCWVDGPAFAGLYTTNTFGLTSTGTLYSNCGTSTADSANVVLDTGTNGVSLDAAAMDEGAPNATGGTLNIRAATDVLVKIPLLYFSNSGNGIYIGATCARITIVGTYVLPFAAGRIPVNTIKIVAGAADVKLIGVKTNIAYGGGDISDAGTNTRYVEVNGYGLFATTAVAAAPQTVTPDPLVASEQEYTLADGAGTITVAAPANKWKGARLMLKFVNPATTVPTLALNAIYKVNWTPSAVVSKINTLLVEYDGTNWIQVGGVVGI